MILILPNGVIRRGWTGPKSYLAEGSSLFTDEMWMAMVESAEGETFEQKEAELMNRLGIIEEMI